MNSMKTAVDGIFQCLVGNTEGIVALVEVRCIFATLGTRGYAMHEETEQCQMFQRTKLGMVTKSVGEAFIVNVGMI